MSMVDEATDPSAPGGDILAVDDQPGDLKLLSVLLGAEGFVVRPATDGELALRSVAARPPDLILLDYRLPGMDGVEVCRRLKADPATAEIPVLFISGMHDDREKAKAFAVGAVDFITKPLRREEVLARVRAHLALVHGRRLLVRERDRLREHAELMRTTLHSIGDAVITTDREGRVSLMNPVSEALTGWTADEARGRPLTEVFRIVNEETRAPVESPAAEVRRSGAVVGLANHTLLIARDGSERPVADSGAPIRGAAGELLGVVLVFRDRSEERRRTRELLRLNALLKVARSVQQHILSERDPSRLIELTCRELAKSWEGCRAWIFLTREGRSVSGAVAAGFDDAGSCPAALALEGKAPRCLAALDRPGALSGAELRSLCESCPLAVANPDPAKVVTRLGAEGHGFGVLGISYAGREGVPREEEEELVELAGDLFLALRSLEGEEALRRAEAERAAQARRNDALVQALGEIVYEARPSRDEVVWGGDYTRVLGYANGELGTDDAGWRSRIHPDDLASVLAEVDAATRERRLIDAEYRFRARDGSYRWIRDRGVVSVDAEGRLERVVGVFADIGRRKADEQTMLRQLDEIAFYYDNAPVGLAVLDRDLRFVRMNGVLAAFTGRPARDHLGRAVGDVLPSLEVGARDAVSRLRGSGAEAVDVEQVGSVAGDPKAHRAWLESWRPVRDESGDIDEYLLMVQDVTERKNLEAKIREADRLASLGLLAAGVAHEINNPLSYVLYNLESLTEDLPKLLGSVRRALVELDERAGLAEAAPGPDREWLDPSALDGVVSRFGDALEGTQRIKEVARGLGAFARVGGRRDGPVDLRLVLDAATGMVANELKYRARLVKEYGELPPIAANDGRLSQVFLNVLVNAVHAIEEGDVGGNFVNVRTWQEGDEVFAEIRDSGKGIPSEHLPRLFEPFYTTKQIGVGSGLGLAISKGIVEGYGGRIYVESEVGRGTRVVVGLPVGKATGRAEAAPSPCPAAPSDAPGRVLVIDDEPGIRGAMVRMLRGYDVVEAASGEDAQRVLEADQAFDLILCDVMMPSMSGVELHAWLEATNPALASQLVFVTGGAFTPKAREHLNRVGNLRLEKPFDVGAFKTLVGEQVKASRRRSKGD